MFLFLSYVNQKKLTSFEFYGMNHSESILLLISIDSFEYCIILVYGCLAVYERNINYILALCCGMLNCQQPSATTDTNHN